LDELLDRARPGDALVVDILDMDRPTARRILRREPAAVLNVAASYSGRFPVTGPALLVESGVALIDGLGSAASLLRDGERIELADGQVMLHGTTVARGRRRTLADLGLDSVAADGSGGVRIRTEAFVADTVALVRATESSPSLVVTSDLRNLVQGRAVVVVTGPLDAGQGKTVDAIADPVMVAAGDDGAGAIQALRRPTSVVIGGTIARDSSDATGGAAGGDDVDDAGSASTSRRRRGRNSAAPATLRLPRPALRSLNDGTAALMLAAGARAVVLAGPDGVDDPLMGLLDRPRADAASTGLLRLEAGGRLVALSTLESLTHTARVSGGDRSARGSAGERRSLTGLFSGSVATPRRKAAVVAAALVATVGLGIVLGSGPLSSWGPAGADLTTSKATIATLSSTKAELARRDRASEAFLASQQAALVAGQLKDRRVVVVSAADVDVPVLAGLNQVLTESGAAVAGVVRLTDDFVAPARQTSLDDLATRLAPEGATLAVGPVGTKVRAGLAASIATPSKAAVGVAVPQGQGLLDALVQIGAIEVTGTPSQRSDLVVLVVSNGGLAATSQVLAALGATLANQSVATIVSAPGTPRPGSAVVIAQKAPQASARLSSSEQVARAIGRIALVNALVAGTKGQFGVFGGALATSETPAPAISPTPTSSPVATTPGEP